MRRTTVLTLLLLPLLVHSACRDKTGPGRVLTSIVITPANPSLADGATVQLTATLRDQNGETFTSLPAGMSLTWSSTDAATASVSGTGLVTGERPGQAQITAAAGGVNASTQVTVTQVATTLALVGGSGQQAVEGSVLADSLRVRVTDRHGSPVAGVSVQFVITSGGGSVAPATATTDAAGHAGAVWTLGPAAGANTAEARAAGLAGSPVMFTAEGTPAVGPFAESHSVQGMRPLVHHQGRFYHALFDTSTGDWDIYLRTSDDAVSWTAKVLVSDAAPGSDQWTASIAVWGSGTATRVAVGYVSFETANPQLRVAVSTDGGQTFAPSVAVSNHTDNSQLQGSIAVGEDGVLYAAWVRMTGSNSWTHTWFSRSTDGGASWSTPQVVFNNGRPFNNEVHLAAGATGEVWIVTAADEGNRKNLILNRSTNGGASWMQSHVTSHPFGGLAEFPTLLRAPGGTLYLAWQDRPTTSDSWRVRLARSTDGGASWGTPVQVSDEVALGAGQGNFRIRPSLAIAPDGTLYVVWTDERLGSGGGLEARNYDVYHSRSTDGGATWSVDERVNDMPGVLSQYLGAVAADASGALVLWLDHRSGQQRLLQRRMP